MQYIKCNTQYGQLRCGGEVIIHLEVQKGDIFALKTY